MRALGISSNAKPLLGGERKIQSPMIEVLNDQEVLAAFESCTLPLDAWIDQEHVRICFLYASQHPLPVALDLMRKAIKAFNPSKQNPESLGRGYHETMTVAFMRLMHDSLLRNGPFPNSDAICDHHPQLLNKLVLRKLYSRERIVTVVAKREFVESDFSELPGSLL